MPNRRTSLINRFEKTFKSSIKENYRKESFFKQKWKRRKDNLPHKILDKTGRMKKSYVFNKNRTTLAIKNTADYSGYHHTGTPRMPARKVVGASKELITNITKDVKEFIKDSIFKR